MRQRNIHGLSTGWLKSDIHTWIYPWIYPWIFISAASLSSYGKPVLGKDSDLPLSRQTMKWKRETTTSRELKQQQQQQHQVNSASYPQRDRKWVVAYGLRVENRCDWLGRSYVSWLHCKPNCSLTRAMDGRIVCCGMISSCQLSATSRDCKAFLSTSLVHVSSATASTEFYVNFYFYLFVIIE